MIRIFLLLLLSITPCLALDVHSLFGDNMVLQREMKVPVWGKAAPGAAVSVSFAGKTTEDKADTDGNWKVYLEPLAASSEGREMTISSGDKKRTFKEVLVGEVWVGSGQSNMAGKVSAYTKGDPTLAELVANAPYPNIRIKIKGWQQADANAVNSCSALLFAFGERLHRDLNVPVGLYFGAVGGTPSGSWIPPQIFAESQKCKDEIAQFAKTYDPERAKKMHAEKLKKWEAAAEIAKKAGRKPRGRKPPAPVNPGESMRGGAIGGLFDRYITQAVGFGIRGVLWDQGEAGTGILGLGQHTAMSELIRGWREVWGQGDFPFLFVQKPSGEGCAFSKKNPITREASEYSGLPKSVIQNGQGRYLYTQIMLDNEDSWMVPACDLGGKIHPVNKWGYGNRAAEIALQKVYQKEGILGYGPLYQSHKIDGSKVTVTFTETGSGMTTAHSKSLQGFSLAGEDGKWHWADAKITGKNSVVVSAKAVPQPTQVRYAFAVTRDWANLFNKEGLPALAFTSE